MAKKAPKKLYVVFDMEYGELLTFENLKDAREELKCQNNTSFLSKEEKEDFIPSVILTYTQE